MSVEDDGASLTLASSSGGQALPHYCSRQRLEVICCLSFFLASTHSIAKDLHLMVSVEQHLLP